MQLKPIPAIAVLVVVVASLLVTGCTSSPTSSPTNTTSSTQTGVELSAYRNGTNSSEFGTLYQITVKLTNNGPGNFDFEKDITFYTSGQPVTSRVTTITAGAFKIKAPAGNDFNASSILPGSTGVLTFGFESAYPTMLTYNDGNSTKTVQL